MSKKKKKRIMKAWLKPVLNKMKQAIIFFLLN